MLLCETCVDESLQFEMRALTFWVNKLQTSRPMDPQCRKTHRVKALSAAVEIAAILTTMEEAGIEGDPTTPRPPPKH